MSKEIRKPEPQDKAVLRGLALKPQHKTQPKRREPPVRELLTYCPRCNRRLILDRAGTQECHSCSFRTR